MDESQQKEVDVGPLWAEAYGRIHDEFVRTETKLETAIAQSKDPFLTLTDLTKFIKLLYGDLSSFFEVMNLLMKSVGNLQRKHVIVHSDVAQLRIDLDTNIKTTSDTLEAINKFIDQYKDMLLELANERTLKNRAVGSNQPQSGGAAPRQ